jgi:hypothetical protein
MIRDVVQNLIYQFMKKAPMSPGSESGQSRHPGLEGHATHANDDVDTLGSSGKSSSKHTSLPTTVSSAMNLPMAATTKKRISTLPSGDKPHQYQQQSLNIYSSGSSKNNNINISREPKVNVDGLNDPFKYVHDGLAVPVHQDLDNPSMQASQPLQPQPQPRSATTNLYSDHQHSSIQQIENDGYMGISPQLPPSQHPLQRHGAQRHSPSHHHHHHHYSHTNSPKRQSKLHSSKITYDEVCFIHPEMEHVRQPLKSPNFEAAQKTSQQINKSQHGQQVNISPEDQQNLNSKGSGTGGMGMVAKEDDLGGQHYSEGVYEDPNITTQRSCCETNNNTFNLSLGLPPSSRSLSLRIRNTHHRWHDHRHS